VLTIPLFLHFFVFRASGLTALPSILLIGPSGAGKTSLITLVSRIECHLKLESHSSFRSLIGDSMRPHIRLKYRMQLNVRCQLAGWQLPRSTDPSMTQRIKCTKNSSL
jgi:energy-coupling factor transporter ATP-binding protein EcfA2